MKINFLLPIFLLSTFQVFSRTPSKDVRANTNGKPLLFIENKGQFVGLDGRVRTDVDFKMSVGSMNVVVCSGMLQYQWNRQTGNGVHQIRSLNVYLKNANKAAVLIKEKKQTYYENYYLPQCPDGISAESYAKLTYRDIYPNIDWVLYPSNGTLKYDFIVRPGGKVSDIILSYEGDSILKLNEGGSLSAITATDSITEDAPYAYTVTFGNGSPVKKTVASKFQLHGKEVSFMTGSHEGTLVIDPAVRWSLYYGGINNDEAFSVVSSAGNPVDFRTYVAGTTVSYNILPFSGNAVHQSTHADSAANRNLEDAFIAAYDAYGNCQWSTYYGGPEKEEFRSIVLDKDEHIYAAGGTRSSSGVAAGDVWQLLPGGGDLGGTLPKYTDGMLVKFDKNGKRIWGTYVGGDKWDNLWSVTLDPDENIYVVGETVSTGNAIASPGCFRGVNTGIYDNRDAFIMKFTNDGKNRLWGSYYGDVSDDVGRAVICDEHGNVYMAGHTFDDTVGNMSTPGRDTLIASPNAHQFLPGTPQEQSTRSDAFLVKFTSWGNRLWGTYYGGGKDEYASCLAYDSRGFVTGEGDSVNGIVYMGGQASSLNNIASPNGQYLVFRGVPMPPPPLEPSNDSGNNGFIAAFTETGKRYWGTYLGDSVRTTIKSMHMHKSGMLMAVGNSGGKKYLITDDAFDTTSLAQDGFVIAFDQSALSYGTFFGGSSRDEPMAIFNAERGETYITGSTFSDDIGYHFSSNTIDGLQKKGTIDKDVFVLRIDLDLRRWQYWPDLYDAFQCLGTTYTTSIGVSDMSKTLFLDGNRIVVQMSDANGSFVNPKQIGEGNESGITWTVPSDIIPGEGYRLRLVSSRPEIISDPLPLYVSATPYPVIVSDTVFCLGDTLRLTVTDTLQSVSYEWMKNADLLFSVADTFIADAVLSHSGQYRVVGRAISGCEASDAITIAVRPLPTLSNVTNNSPVCAGSELKLSAFADTAGGAIFNWSGPGFNASGQNVSLPAPQLTDAGMYKVKLTKYGCSSEDSTLVVIDTLPSTPDGTSKGPLCHGDTLKLFATSTTPGVTYLWRGPGNFSSTLANPLLLKMNASGSGIYTVTTKLGNCSSVPDSVEVIVPEPVPAPEVSSNSPVKEGDVLRLYANGEPGASYAWVGPDSFSSQEQNPLINEVRMSATGVYHVSATVNGCSASASTTVVINGVSEVYFLMFPNPNDGTFRIKATMDKEQVVPIQVLNVAGQLVYETELTSRRRLLDTEIKLPGSLSSGKYHLRLRIDGTYKVIPFVINP